MATSTEWQLAHDAAERYERILVAAILGPFARALVDRAALHPGESVLDVGCGTGTAARYAAQQVGFTGHVVGIDVNYGMIEVARSLRQIHGAAIDWYVDNAYQLPLADATFDVVLCAQTLQFITDRTLALQEMLRVLKPAGRVAMSLWQPIHENPYFDTLVELVARHINTETAAGLGAAFGLTDADEIQALVEAAGFRGIEMASIQLDLRLPAFEAFVPNHISATPMAAGYQSAPPAAQAAVVAELSQRLADFVTADGPQVPFRSHLVTAFKEVAGTTDDVG